MLVENRPRRQVRGEAIRAEQGKLPIFPAHDRPVPGRRGTLRGTVMLPHPERHWMGRPRVDELVEQAIRHSPMPA